MIFSAPTPFFEALQRREVQSVLPTSLSSQEIADRLAPEFTERALLSARTTNAEYLQTIGDVIDSILDPQTVTGGDRNVTAGMDQATARLTLKNKLRELGYEPSADDRGTIKDLGSDRRLDLVISTNVEMAQGYGNWMQGQDEAVLDEFPAQELFRALDREKPREWQRRWSEAASATGVETSGFIALKNTRIWPALSRFGTPYPPFDFNSGMDVRDVTRDEAEALSLIDRDTQVQPQERGFNDDLKFTPQVRDRALRQALVESDDSLHFDGDVLKLGRNAA
jgi:hypothetical protein